MSSKSLGASASAGRRPSLGQWNWALLDQALVSGSNFLVGLLLVRYLGMEQYGRYVLAWMLVQFALSVQSALVVAPMLSLAPTLESERRKAYYDATLVLQAGLLVVLAAGLGVAWLLPAAWLPAWLDGETLPVLGACLLLVLAQDYLRRALFSRHAARRAFVLDMLAYGLQLPLLLWVLQGEASPTRALLVIALAMLLALLPGGYWVRPRWPAADVLGETARRHWRSSRWLLGSALLQWLSANYFLLVAGVLLGPVMVGAIRAAQNLLGLTHILFQGLENVVPGQASARLAQDGPEALVGYIGRTALVLLLVTGAVAGAAALCAEPLLGFVYGEVSATAIAALGWFVPFYMLAALVLPLRAGLRSLERTRAIFFAQLGCALFALALAHPVVARWQLDGVMAGMVFSSLATALGLGLALRRAARCRQG